MKDKAFMRLLVVLISAELIFFAYGAFYQNRILNRRMRDFSADRYRDSGDHRIYRVFTIDKIIIRCSEEEAMEELLRGDLRTAVFVDDGSQLSELSNRLSVIGNQSAGSAGSQTDYRSLITDYQSFKRDPAFIEHFNELQSANSITELDFSNPNRVEMEVDITVPAALVMTDLWHRDWKVKIDGKAQPLYRVNYLQRGVWCTAGKHRIIMEFRPVSLRRGGFMTMVGVVSFIFILIISCRQAGSKSVSQQPDFEE